MYMTEQERAHARVLASTLDKLTRHPKRISPSAPWIIPALMIFVALFALTCLLIKLFMTYFRTKSQKTKAYGVSTAGSPCTPTTPEDQTSMATTASLKTRGSLRLNSNRRQRTKPPPVSLYQMKQKQSPGSSSSKPKTHRAAMKAISRAAKSEANRSITRDSTMQMDDRNSDGNNDDVNNSPTNSLSEYTDDVQQSVSPSALVYGGNSNKDETDGLNVSSSNQPEVHIVQIRDLDDNVQHSQPTWPQAESEI